MRPRPGPVPPVAASRRRWVGEGQEVAPPDKGTPAVRRVRKAEELAPRASPVTEGRIRVGGPKRPKEVLFNEVPLHCLDRPCAGSHRRDARRPHGIGVRPDQACVRSLVAARRRARLPSSRRDPQVRPRGLPQAPQPPPHAPRRDASRRSTQGPAQGPGSGGRAADDSSGRGSPRGRGQDARPAPPHPPWHAASAASASAPGPVAAGAPTRTTHPSTRVSPPIPGGLELGRDREAPDRLGRARGPAFGHRRHHVRLAAPHLLPDRLGPRVHHSLHRELGHVRGRGPEGPHPRRGPRGRRPRRPHDGGGPGLRAGSTTSGR